MGAQVYNRMIEQRLPHTPPPIRITAANRPIASSGSNAARIKRNLFGRVDSTTVKLFVEEQIASQNEEKRKKWNFDFTTGRPDENGSYKWERVTAPVTVSPSSAMVTLTRAAHMSSTSAGRRRAPVVDERQEEEPLSMQSLLDQRAEKANVGEVDVSPVDEVPEAIRTYPNLRSTTTATVTSATIEPLPSTPPSSPSSGSSSTSSTSSSSSRVTRSRQMRITEFLKERKRLSTGASVGRTQAKKVRLIATMSSNGADPKKAITSPVTRRHSVPSTSSG
ncbi:mucin-5AC-like [Anopheles aquasalis]|uniref:mucin-5AC-like n=1 Tax=Anopheles aquasalis TaxID=42839 RepID=UPI00215AF248|nr:mucin-5AC-like [Anopheles aquasalis]